MLLLRWSYFAAPAPDAEVVALFTDDFEEELDDDVLLGPAPENDPVDINRADDDPDATDEDDADANVAVPENDFLQFLLSDDADDDDAEDFELRFQLENDFIASIFDDDAEDDADDDYAALFQQENDFIEIFRADDDEDSDVEDELLEFFDFGNPPGTFADITEIIGMLMDDTSDPDDDQLDFEDDPWDWSLIANLPAPLQQIVTEWLITARRRGTR